MSALPLASARGQVADYVLALVTVYWIILIAYILVSLYQNFGGRIPYHRWLAALIGFLRDVSEPYLGLFRRFIPPMGPLDLSPIVGIFVLFLVGNLLASAIRG
jgi:YggT family protein